MSTRTVTARTLPGIDPRDRDLETAWRTWLAVHGLPTAEDIPAGGPIICDDDARTVTTLRFVRTAGGKQAVHPDLVRDQITDPERVVWGRNELVKEWVTVQLEAPAMPFPPGGEVTVD